MKFLICIGITIITVNLYSQTFVNPFIGVDLLDIQSKEVDPPRYDYYIYEKRYSAESFPIGVELEQLISNKLNLTVSSSYSCKKAIASVKSFGSFGGFRFEYLQNTFRLNFKPTQLIFIGVGYSYNILRNFRNGYDKPSKFVFIDSKISHGPTLSIGCYYKRFKITTYFNKGLNDNLDESGLNLHPINSFGLNIAYRFKIFDLQKNRKGEDCPKF